MPRRRNDQPPRRASPRLLPGGRSAPSLLLVEPRAELRERLVGLVVDLPDVRVREATSVREALEIAAGERFDAVALDVEVDTGAALAALQRIRTAAPWAVLLALGANFYFVLSEDLPRLRDLLATMVAVWR